MGILDFLLGGGGQQDPRQAPQPYLPGRTRMPFDIPMQSGQSGQATVPAQMTNPLERPNPWIPGQGSTQADQPNQYRNESMMPEWMDRYVPSPRGAMTGDPFATQQDINQGMGAPSPISFNPGLREGQNYPMTEPYWNTNPTRPPPPEPQMPPGWQPPGAAPQIDPRLLELMQRGGPQGRPPGQMPGRLWNDRKKGQMI